MRVVTCIVIIVLFVSSAALANNQYILAGATGTYATTQCDTWQLDRACGDFPAKVSWIRGDTYYLGNGLYPANTTYTGTSKATIAISTAVDGSAVITVKKATIADHGTDTGWINDYAGQAVFTKATGDYNAGIAVTVPYVTIDGSYGTANDKTSYGILLQPSSDSCATPNRTGVSLCSTGSTNDCDVSNNILKYIAIEGCINKTASACAISMEPKVITSSGFVFDHIYITNWANAIGLTRVANGDIRNSYIDAPWVCDSLVTCKSQTISPQATSNINLYNNIFEDTIFTVISGHGTGGGNYNWKVFNNIMLRSNGGAYFAANVVIPQDISVRYDVMANWDIHHNTMIDVQFYSYGFVVNGPVTDETNYKTRVYNNLIYGSSDAKIKNDCVVYGCSLSTLLHDYNAYINSTGTDNRDDESNMIEADGVEHASLFTDYANDDVSIVAGAMVISNGKTDLGSPYNYDIVGTYRGLLPDIGAYQYDGETTYTVTPSTTGGCVIYPDEAAFVTAGDTSVFTCTAKPNWQCTGWVGTCGGSGTTTYTTNAIIAGCTVIQPCSKQFPAASVVSGSSGIIGTGSVAHIQ